MLFPLYSLGVVIFGKIGYNLSPKFDQRGFRRHGGVLLLKRKEG
jgi:hypothetical protein